MTATMSAAEKFRALRALDVPESLARKAAGLDAPVSVDFMRVEGPMLAFPIHIRVPWSALISDNDKYGVTMRGTMAKPFPKLILQARYREAKLKAREAGKAVMGTCPPLTMPLAFTGRVWVPDNRGGHDVCNFAKCLLDALQKTVYANDDQLHDVRWIRAGVDVDAPRCEIEIAPL